MKTDEIEVLPTSLPLVSRHIQHALHSDIQLCNIVGDTNFSREGRNIHEQIVLAHKLVNQILVKRRGGNVEIGVPKQWCDWLEVKCARSSVLVNGGPEGFSSASKEDYQWLVEKVLSTYQVPSGQIVSRDKSKLFDGGTYFREDAVQTSTWRQFLCLSVLPIYRMSIYKWAKSVVVDCGLVEQARSGE
ncbi:hypothetical protein C5167_005492 [Papaver somniferum]|uniref:Uncharacterized protein n=1 Tax=Papaver somniferum TaxID=3469 RepID=A0A4Y7JDR5_PAPSO|nr:hypothetical protein C5167_005492 [Papaver somniferum]